MDQIIIHNGKAGLYPVIKGAPFLNKLKFLAGQKALSFDGSHRASCSFDGEPKILEKLISSDFVDEINLVISKSFPENLGYKASQNVYPLFSTRTVITQVDVSSFEELLLEAFFYAWHYAGGRNESWFALGLASLTMVISTAHKKLGLIWWERESNVMTSDKFNQIFREVEIKLNAFLKQSENGPIFHKSFLDLLVFVMGKSSEMYKSVHDKAQSKEVKIS